MKSASYMRRNRTFPVDAACAEAIDLARGIAGEIAESGEVGEHVGLTADGDRIVTHYFECLDPAYKGWRWAITVVRASRAKKVTVSDSVLLPGEEALMAPEWVPWSDRLRPGDLGPGDLLPTAPDDERLVPAFGDVSDDADRQMLWELGLGRPRVLSAEGRDAASERWYASAGPSAPVARSAPAHCASCGFFVLLAGELRGMFGVCANEYAPDDGTVVSADHGCGAHSEAVSAPSATGVAAPIVDDMGYDLVHAPNR